MKIGIVLDDTLDKPDGVQQYVLTLGSWLTGRGHEVHYLVAETQRTDLLGVHSLARLVSANFNGNGVRTPLPASRRRIRKLLRELQLDVLHVQLPCSPFFAARVVKAASKSTAVVGTFHILPTSLWHMAANKLLGWWLHRALRHFDAVMAVSEPGKFAKKAYGLETTVVPNVVDVARFARGHLYDDTTRSDTLAEQKRDAVTVVFLGRLVPRKGVLWLIKAFNGLPPETQGKARLVIGGRGPQLQQAQVLAKNNPQISFAGFVSEHDKPAFLARADVAVFPSTGGESFGIILVEAVAAGSGIVLGGNNPGYASVLGAQPESLVNPADTPAFTALLKRFIDDSGARANLHAAQQEIAHRYDVEHVGPMIEGVYNRARIKRQPKPQPQPTAVPQA